MSGSMFISVGIPTYQFGESLIAVLDSISRQTCYKNITEVVVVIDGQENFSEDIKKRILDKKVRIKIFENRKGQSARINSIFNELNSDLLILTNDDVILERDAIEKIADCFINQKADLICAKTVPLSPANLLEKSLAIGHNLNHVIAKSWNQGDNYLACNGRLMGLSKKLYKKVRIPEKLWNSDAFLYLFSKVNNFKVAACFGATVFFKFPANLKEHLNQSIKFQTSKKDNQRYFKQNISKFYEVPNRFGFKFLIAYLFKKPFYSLSYLIVFQISRFKALRRSLEEKNYWDLDESTKNLDVFSPSLFKMFTFIGFLYYNTLPKVFLSLHGRIIG